MTTMEEHLATKQVTTSSSSSSSSEWCCSDSSSSSSLSLSQFRNTTEIPTTKTTKKITKNRTSTTTTNSTTSSSKSIIGTTKSCATKSSNPNDTTEHNQQPPNTTTNNDNDEQQQQQYYEKELFVPALMMRLYHLPGYTYRQDLWQYLSNNHPVIGICYHHKYHPVNFWERCLALIGSICFGLAITNIIYLSFVFTNIDSNETYFEIPTSLVWNSTLWNTTIGSVSSSSTTSATTNERFYQLGQLIEQNAVQSLSVSNGNIALWTIGATFHALYDNMIWQLASYSCCLKEDMNLVQRHDQYGYRGTYLIILSVIVVVAITTFVVALRQAMDEANIDNDESANFIDTIHNIRVYQKAAVTSSSSSISNTTNSTTTPPPNEITLYARTNIQDYQFLISYGIELLLTYFVYYPIVNIILFTGICSCFGKFYYCGGYPYERNHYPLPETIDELIIAKNNNTNEHSNNENTTDDENEETNMVKKNTDTNNTIPTNV